MKSTRLIHLAHGRVMFGASRFNSGWAAEGAMELSLWFGGESMNVAEPLYVGAWLRHKSGFFNLYV
jgi:hypothetical protein